MAESLAGNMSLPLSVPSFLSIHMVTMHGQMLRWALGFDWSRIAILLGYIVFIVGTFHFVCNGLPKKAARDPQVDKGCPCFLLTFMGLVYASVYFTTDQYVPNLPQMEFDLQGSQTLMSGTVNLNIMVKGVAGMVTASLSDSVGRRPVLLTCTTMLMIGSFLCGCATRIENFIAARVLQGLGEAVEPVIIAMARDYLSNPEERLKTIAALECIDFLATSIAPTFGALMATSFGWRSSFFVLSGAWGLLAIYALLYVVESAPDCEKGSYFKDLHRIMTDPSLLFLLLTEACILGALFVFDANNSYLLEVTYGHSPLFSALVMLGFGVLAGLGAYFVDKLNVGSVLQVAKLTCALYAGTGVISFFLGLLFPGATSYVVGSFLQASLMMMAFTAVNVMYFEPLEDCAGLAAACEAFVQSMPPGIIAALATRVAVTGGAQCVVLCQASVCIAAGMVFWLGYAFFPPATLTYSASMENILTTPELKKGAALAELAPESSSMS